MDGSRAGSSEAPRQLGEFQILHVLGEGGSGVVYAARWGHREVALKVLRDNLVATDSERRRFFDEARSLSEIKHPSVVKVLSFGALPDGRPFLAMELLHGETLSQRIAQGPIPLAHALELFDQLVGAVDAMHQRGLVHRDLKPENVVVVSGGQYVVLLDFGIAKELDARPSTVTQEGGIRGTPAYMAPERFFGQPASQTTDVYELAVTLFAMLVGRLPWDSAHDPNDRLDPKRPSDLGVTLPSELEALLLRALSTRPEVRPRSAAELCAAVRAAANLIAPPLVRATAPISSSETPGPSPHSLGHASTVAHTTRTRRRVGIAAAAAMLVALSVALAIALWPPDDAESVSAAAEQVEEPDDGAGQVGTDDDPPDTEPPTRRTGDDSRMFAVTQHHPADTEVIVGLRARELRQSAALVEVFDRSQDTAWAQLANVYARPCKVDLFEDLDWITIGVAGKERDLADIVVAGNWKRDQIESCLGDLTGALQLGTPKTVTPDGDITRLDYGDHELAVGWLDERTLMFSTRDNANAKWMRARLQGQGSMVKTGRLATVASRIDTRATFWLAGDSDPDLAKEVLGDVEPPESLWMTFHISSSVAFEAGAVFDSGERARAADSALQAWFDRQIKAEPMMDLFLRTVKHRAQENSLLVSAEIDEGLTTLIVRALEQQVQKELR